MYHIYLQYLGREYIQPCPRVSHNVGYHNRVPAKVAALLHEVLSTLLSWAVQCGDHVLLCVHVCVCVCVRSLSIICEPRETDRHILDDFWNGRQPQHTGVWGNLRPNAERAGLWHVNERQNLHNGWWAEGAIRNDLLLLHVAEVENTVKHRCHPAW